MLFLHGAECSRAGHSGSAVGGRLLEVFSDLRIAGSAATSASVRQEFLGTTGAIDLADVDVALRVDAERVRPVKGARLPAARPDASQFGEVVTIEDVDREI